MSALFGALGSLIGYLGSEVAEVSMFESLLWPHRYNHSSDPSVLLKQALLMTMGGPLHAAALATLDTLREHGLYLGRRRGNLLGTAFYSDIGVPYFCRTTSTEKNVRKESRNGLWIRTLRDINKTSNDDGKASSDCEASTGNTSAFLSTQLVYHLHLRAVGDNEVRGSSTVYVEDGVTPYNTFIMLLSILFSELSAIATAILAGALFHTWWLVGYMCIPLILKLLAAVFTVRRQGLKDGGGVLVDANSANASIFELEDPNHGFALVEGPATIVQQFFRHYGHPVRDLDSGFLTDRTREVLCIMLIYGFVLYFPAGLLGVLWMDPSVQYLWLGYQLYAILAMHVVRVLGWQGCGRTEYLIARHLEKDHEVWLRDSKGFTVAARLNIELVRSQAEGKQRVQSIINSVPREGSKPGGKVATNTVDNAAL